MPKLTMLSPLILAAGVLSIISSTKAELDMKATPPSAMKIPRIRTLHGEKFVDDYFYLNDKKNPEVINYLNAENKYANTVLAPTKALQAKLYKEIVGRIKETDLEVPVLDRGYHYYSRTVKGKQYPIRCRRKGTMKAPEEILLDLNTMGKDKGKLKAFLSVGTFAVSDDGNLLAYSLDTSGFREYELYFKDLKSGKQMKQRFGKVQQVAWSSDSRTVFYVTEDKAKRSYRVWRRRLDGAKAELIYEEKDALYNVYINRSADRKVLFLTSGSSETSEVRFISSSSPEDKPKLIAARKTDREYYVDHAGGIFYIRDNRDAKDFKVMRAPASDFREANWTELVPEVRGAKIEQMLFLSSHLVLFRRESAVPKILVTNLKSGKSHSVKMPEAIYSVFEGGNPDSASKKLRFTYMSYTTPASVMEYDLASHKKTLLKREDVRGGYDPAKYKSELLWATAKDGTRIPLAITYKKTTKPGPNTPLRLDGYGSYGIPSSPTFGSPRLSLLDRGFIIAEAYVRGGGEMGEEWHDQGKMKHKMNTFTDFIACADFLVEKGYSSHEKMCMEGGSAGGLLMGAVLNLRPDLVKAALLYVPFVDVINTMLDESLPLTVGEFLEWGNPKVKEQYEWIAEYSPYDNLEDKSYPAMLVRTSLNDSQVLFHEPAKYVAKMRTMRADPNPLLFLCNMNAGHGGSSGRYDKYKETATDYAFLLTTLGVEKATR